MYYVGNATIGNATILADKVRQLEEELAGYRQSRDQIFVTLMDIHGHSSYALAKYTDSTRQAVDRIRKRERADRRAAQVEQLREWLRKKGYTDIPTSHKVAVFTIPIMSQLTKRQMIDGMPADRRKYEYEVAEAYGPEYEKDLDSRDVGTVRIAKVRTRNGRSDEDFDLWLRKKAQEIPIGYDIITDSNEEDSK